MRSLNLLIAGLIVVILFASCSKQDKLEINSTSFMYSADSSSDQKIQVELNGYFDNKDNYFKGILKINDGIEYPTVLFSPGLSGLIAYNGKERIYLGEIFFDKNSQHFTLEISNADLYYSLTHKKYENQKLIISSPAESLEQAIEMNRTLKLPVMTPNK